MDEGGARWDSVNGGGELLRIKKSKGTKIRNGSKRIERMKDRSSDECIFFLYIGGERWMLCVDVIEIKKKKK